MDDPPPTPKRPGWYLDPCESAFNDALRERWRRQVLYLGPENVYRLRRWDGQAWTDETLRNYQATGPSAFPYLVGPTTRIYPITPDRAKRGLKIWAVLMTVSIVGALLFEILK